MTRHLHSYCATPLLTVAHPCDVFHRHFSCCVLATSDRRLKLPAQPGIPENKAGCGLADILRFRTMLAST
jgi:hypothetical protein